MYAQDLGVYACKQASSRQYRHVCACEPSSSRWALMSGGVSVCEQCICMLASELL